MEAIRIRRTPHPCYVLHADEFSSLRTQSDDGIGFSDNCVATPAVCLRGYVERLVYYSIVVTEDYSRLDFFWGGGGVLNILCKHVLDCKANKYEYQ